MCVKYESTKTAKAIPHDTIHHTPTKEVIFRKEHLMLHTMKGAKMYQRNPVTAFLLTCDLKHSLQFMQQGRFISQLSETYIADKN